MMIKEPGHFEVRKSSIQVRSSGVPDAAKGSTTCPQWSDRLTSHLLQRLRGEKWKS